MIEVDESDLIEFFGGAPEAEPTEEREFFAAPLFVKAIDGLELRFSLSAQFRDLRLSLRQADRADAALELVVPGVVGISIDRDGARRLLRVTSKTHGVTEIAVEPTITIRCDGLTDLGSG